MGNFSIKDDEINNEYKELNSSDDEKDKIDKTEINKNNKETLEIMKEKLNLYKYSNCH